MGSQFKTEGRQACSVLPHDPSMETCDLGRC